LHAYEFDVTSGQCLTERPDVNRGDLATIGRGKAVANLCHGRIQVAGRGVA